MNKQTIVGALALIVALGALVAVVANNFKTLPPTPKTYPARGKLVFKNGEPVRFAILNLTPKTNKSGGGDCEARTGADGSFEVRSFSNTGNDGAVPGEYVGSLEPYSSGRLGPIGKSGKPSAIPKKYQDTSTAGITVVIKAEENDLGTIQLN
jgi:hypothetical protein